MICIGYCIYMSLSCSVYSLAALMWRPLLLPVLPVLARLAQPSFKLSSWKGVFISKWWAYKIYKNQTKKILGVDGCENLRMILTGHFNQAFLTCKDWSRVKIVVVVVSFYYIATAHSSKINAQPFSVVNNRGHRRDDHHPELVDEPVQTGSAGRDHGHFFTGRKKIVFISQYVYFTWSALNCKPL